MHGVKLATAVVTACSVCLCMATSTSAEFSGNSNPDGTIVASGGEDGIVHVWNAADAAEIVQFAPPAL